MHYEPIPMDTSGTALPPELLDLIERLAANAHDIWAVERMAQGWTYGPQRDDARKLHPCLVPYEDLPDSEKEFDRKTAIGTLKAIMHLGYSILPPR
jgi:adenylate cyclase